MIGQMKQKLGFGCMRMPILQSDDPTSFDFETIEAMVDRFLEKGFTYFDTAYTYHGFRAEEAVRKALVERHPRESFQLATKFPLRDFENAEDLERIFGEQLENCGVTYFDFYLLHNMGSNVYEKCVKYDGFGFVARKKAEGKIRNVGMSFHDTPELLEEVLEKHGDSLDFLQLQVNYADWEQPNVQSRRCLEIARAHGKPVIVMEPCKGGTLAKLPQAAEELFRSIRPEASAASWAMRYAASREGVCLVLSGMGSMEQLEDNMDTFLNFRPLDEEEERVVQKAAEIIHAQTAVPCTACGYCTHGCPKHIPIPQIFALYNSMEQTTDNYSSQPVYYNNLVLRTGSRASDCIACGQCEKACPQRLPVREHLKDAAGKLEKSFFPVRK